MTMCTAKERAHFEKFVSMTVLSTVVLLIGCGGGGGGARNVTLQSISVGPQAPTVAAGLTQQFTATGNFSDGTTSILTSVTWTTSDSSLATVSPAGLVTTLKQGNVTISAAQGSVTGSTNLNVGPPVLVSLNVSSSAPNVAAGLAQQFTATGKFSDGTTNVLTSATWTTSDPTLATVNSTGLVATLKQGSVNVIAAVGSVIGSAGLTIGPPLLVSLNVSPAAPSVALGLTQQFTATGKFTDGTTNVLTSATWTTSDPTLATVNSTGLVATLKQGNVNVIAAVGSISNSAGLTIGPPQLVSLNVSPLAPSVALGLTQQFTAKGKFTDGTTNNLTSVTWTTSDPTLATVNSGGLVATLKQGSVNVIAAVGSVTGSAGLTIGPPQLVSLNVSPSAPSVALGLTQQFTAKGKFTDGTTNTLTSVTWTTSDPTLATVSSAGLVATLKQGNVDVIAAVGSISNSASLTVGPPVPVSLNVSPAASLVVLGASQPTKLSAILNFSDKSTQDVSNQATWTEADPFVAAVDTSGNASGLHIGSTKITATASNLSGAVDLLVIEVPRYLYVATNAGRIISRATIDANTGQLRMAGNVITGANNLAFSCLSTDPSHKFLYVGASIAGSTTAGELLIYSIDQGTGALTPVAGSPFATTAPIGCIEFERTGKFGYASSVNGTTQLLVYSRDDATGVLTQINTLTLNGTASELAVDPLGQYLYAATIALSNPAQAYGYSIDSTTGALNPVPGTPFALSKDTGVFSFHPSGSFLYMANSEGQSVDVYSVDRSTGALAAVSSLATCINPTAVRFTGNGQFGYTACSMDANHDPNSASVETFSVGTDGGLTHLGSAPSPTAPFDLATDPSGHFLYLSSINPYVYSFSIGIDGVAAFARRIGVMPNQSSITAVVGGSAAIKYTTKFAYISSTGDNHLATFPVNPDGTLGPSPGLPTVTQLSPFSLSLLPWGSNLLAASTSPHPNLMGYPLSPTTDLPGLGFNFGDSVTSGGVAIDPTEQWAFETDSTNGVVFTYERFGSSWGLLSYLVNGKLVSSFAAGAGAGPMIIDPSGRFLYVANQSSSANSISAYQYFGTSPELLESTVSFVAPYTDGSPFSVGAKPLAFAFDPAGAFLYVIANDQTLQVYAVDYFSNGHLAKVASVALAGQPAGVAAEPTGRFVYAADSDGVEAFSVDAQTGALTSVPLSPAIALTNISGIFVEPSGTYLYVLTSTSGTGGVFAYAINADGTLTAVSGTPLATPNQPSSMTFSANIR